MHPDLKIARRYLNKAQSAESRGHDFELSFAQYRKLQQTKRCAYTGVLMTAPNGSSAKDTDLSIDRIDAQKGYVPDNVVACCHAANLIKGTIEAPGRLIGLEKMALMLDRIREMKGAELS